MSNFTPNNWLLGSIAALGSAASFAFCSILLQRISSRISPVGANFWKSLAGSLLLLIALLFAGIQPVSSKAFIFLGVSGLLGITLGDTFFFKALVLLGPRLTLLLETLGPVFTVIFAVIFLKENPAPLAWIGIILTISGVSWVLWEQSPSGELKTSWRSGIKYAILFVFCMSIAVILTKVGVRETTALQATFIRMLWALFALFSYGMFFKKFKEWKEPFKEPKFVKLSISALFVGIFGGFWLSTTALKYIDASVAIVLNSTTPIFILPMVSLITKEKITLRAFFGAVTAVAGIACIFIK